MFECVALQDLRVQMPLIFMGVTTMRGFMQQRDLRSVAAFISTAVKRGQDVTSGSGRTPHQPGWLELV